MTEPSCPDVFETPPHPPTGEPPTMPVWVQVARVLVGLVGVVLLALAAVGGAGASGHGPGMHRGLGSTETHGTSAAARGHSWRSWRSPRGLPDEPEQPGGYGHEPVTVRPLSSRPTARTSRPGRSQVSQARPRRRAAHAAPRNRTLALPALSTATPRHGRLIPAPLTAVMVGTVGGGLALLGVFGPDALRVPTRPAAPAVLANAEVAPAPLGAARGDDTERASRSRRAAVPDPEPVPVVTASAAVPATPPSAAAVLPGCDGRSSDVGGYRNGRLPGGVLCTLPGGSGERLRADAAVSFLQLATAYQTALGEPICVTDGYRPLAEQQQLRRTKPRFAARPGFSEHGWGLAVDLSCGVQSFRTEQHAWLVANAGDHGWFLPEWAQRGGARPEPWHWEFSGS